MTYNEFVKKLNEGNFDRVEFAIADYGHYSHCVIDCLRSTDGSLIVRFLLTPDGKEDVTFYGEFRDAKIFRFGRGKKGTLKDVWNRVIVKKTVQYTS